MNDVIKGRKYHQHDNNCETNAKTDLLSPI